MNELTQRDLEQHLRTARKLEPDAAIYGFNLPTGRVDLVSLTLDNERWRIVQAPSELAIRQAMVEQKGDELLAIITPLNERQLAIDVRVRFPARGLFDFNPWGALPTLFGATTLSWELARRDARPLGRALLRCANGRSFPAVTAGILGLDTAWNTYFHRALGFENTPTRLADWFVWAAVNPGSIHRVFEDPELLELLARYLAQTLGSAARTVLQALRIKTQAGAHPHHIFPLVAG
ncbi:MAG: hypothetical protein H0U74_04815, partial [Bradymonadaceae bacterium]|nr:hypothetical protein [Lujinxingiaceae bacterium]